MWLRRRRLLLFFLEEDKRRIVKRLLALRLHFHLLSRVLILQSLQRHCLTPPSPVLLCSTPRPATPSAPENLDISFFNILPSHVYLRKITDVDMVTSDPSLDPSRTAVGTLSHVSIQAMQLTLNDVLFWYRDKIASAITPSEFAGLLVLTLPSYRKSRLHFKPQDRFRKR